MILQNSWKAFLLNHPDVKRICMKLDSLPNSLSPNKPDDNFKILESSPSTILVSFDSVQNQIIPSFAHMSIGNELIDNDTFMIGLTGLSETASPIILNPHTFSSFKSDKAQIPSWNDLISNKEEAIGSGKGKVEFKRFAILPHPLFEVICNSDLSPSAVLDRSISVLVRDQEKIHDHFIKMITSRLTESNDGDPPSDEELQAATSDDELSKLMQNCFYDFLIFLWSTTKKDIADKFIQTCSPVINKPFISDKVQKLHSEVIKSSPEKKDISSPSRFENMIKSVMKSVFEAQSLNSSARLPLAEEEKSKPTKGMKAFTNLGERVSSTILKISSDGSSIPLIPSEGCQEILAAKSGPAVSNLLLHHLSNEDFNMSKGMAHFLGNGQILSPDPSSIANVSPFYIHTKSASSLDTVEQEDLFTLQIMNESNSLQKEDVKELMKNDIFIANDYWQFAIQLRNHFLLWELYTGSDSFLSKSLEMINEHVKANHHTYLDFINNQAHFIVSFLQTIHFRMQNFFKSCISSKDVDEIRFDFLNFSDLLRSVEMHTYSIVTPQWYKVELLKSSKSSKRDLKDPESAEVPPAQKKSKPVVNESIDAACALASNETYRFVFHKHNTNGLSIPKINGSDMCLKYHIEGKCKSTCSRSKTHCKLDSQSLISLRKYVKSVRDNYKSFKEAKKLKFSEQNNDSNTDGDENNNNAEGK